MVVEGRAGKEACTLLEEGFLSFEDSLAGVWLSLDVSLDFSGCLPSSLTPSFGLAVPESKFQKPGK